MLVMAGWWLFKRTSIPVTMSSRKEVGKITCLYLPKNILREPKGARGEELAVNYY